MIAALLNQLRSTPPPYRPYRPCRPCRRAARSAGAPAGLVAMMAALLGLFASAQPTAAQAPAARGAAAAAGQGRAVEETPWDYSPYEVLVWLVGPPGQLDVAQLKPQLHRYLDRDFAALWRTSIASPPAAVQAMMRRDLEAVDADSLAATDPVIAVKRDHPEAARLRVAADVGQRVEAVLATETMIPDLVRRAAAVGDATLDGVVDKLQPLEVDLLALEKLWQEEETEAMLLPRGVAQRLQPEAKIIRLRVDGEVAGVLEQFDKVFVVRVDGGVPITVSAREIDGFLRLTGPVVYQNAAHRDQLPAAIGRALSAAFAPLVRIEEVGSRVVQGRLRAGGLILDERSPAAVGEGDWLQPVLRRDDRDGEPALLEIIDWTYLHARSAEGAKLQMEVHTGRRGGLQGRRNSRTHRIAMKIRPVFDATVLRLHARGNPSRGLAGYEIYEKSLDSSEMTLIGRTDWDGRLRVQKTDSPLRLLYVKNGGAVLARLPIVPGLYRMETADLVGDDLRLQAEAYIRGVENAITDLVAIRALLAARIRLRLEERDVAGAEELLEMLRNQPTYEAIANDMGRTATQIRSDNRAEQRKIDQMFAQTRSLLVQHISPALVRRLETEVREAGGGAARPTPAATPAESDPFTPPDAADADPFTPSDDDDPFTPPSDDTDPFTPADEADPFTPADDDDPFTPAG